MTEHLTSEAGTARPVRGPARTMLAVLLGLTALITVILCAFALPSVNSGPHEVPVGVTGPAAATQGLATSLDPDEWDVRVYDGTEKLTAAVEDRDVAGGLALSSDGVDIYTATSGAPMATNALTRMGSGVAAQQHLDATTHELAPYTQDDPNGAGMTAAALPMIFGGLIPAIILALVFPGPANTRLRMAGSVGFSLLAGFATVAVLQFWTGTLDGNYWLTALGMALGFSALSMFLLWLHSRVGVAGIGIGGAVMMLVGNPLSGLVSGPYWLPDGWSTLGQLLPPGASSTLLRANAFFDGDDAARPVIVLSVWLVASALLIVVGLQLRTMRERRTAAAVADEGQPAVAAAHRAEPALEEPVLDEPVLAGQPLDEPAVDEPALQPAYESAFDAAAEAELFHEDELGEPVARTARHSALDGLEPALHGQVVDPAGAPVVGAMLTITDRLGNQLGRAHTEETGWYAVADLPDDVVTVVLNAPGRAPAVDRVLPSGGIPKRQDFTMGYGLPTHEDEHAPAFAS